jgi:predicted esterase
MSDSATAPEPTAVRPDVREHHLTVARTARYVTVGDAERPSRIWLALHGYGQLAAPFAARCRPLADERAIVVAPEALSRFYLADTASTRSHAQARVGATWMTREDRLAEIGDYIAYLDQLAAHVLTELAAPDAELYLLGFSQGAATASRWAERGTVVPRRVVLWGGLLAEDGDLATLATRLAGTPVEYVVGDEDASCPADGVRAQATRLAGHGIATRVTVFGGGHRLHEPTLAALAAR